MTMTAAAHQGVESLPGFIVYRGGSRLSALAAQLGRQLIFRLLNVVISLGLSVALFFAFKAEVGGVFFWFLVFSASVSVLQLVFHLVRWTRVRSHGRKLQPAPELQIDVLGLVIAKDGDGLRLPWHQVRSVRAKNHPLTPGPNLEICWSPDGQQVEKWQTPVSYLEAQPTQLDSALRSYSRGRFGLDLSRVDRLW